MTIPANPQVAGALLQRCPVASINDLLQVHSDLSNAIRVGMQHTQVYNIPADQGLPADEAITSVAIAQYMHPFNVAAALVSVALAGPALGGAALEIPADLQLYVNGGWAPVAGLQVPGVAVTIVQPEPAAPPPPPPAPPAPPPAPVAAIPAAPPAPSTADLADLVNAALGAPAAVAAAPVIAPVTTPATPSVPTHPAATITTPEQFEAYRAAQGHGPAPVAAPAAPQLSVIESTAVRVETPQAPAPAAVVPAAPPAQHVTLQQAVAASADAEAVGLPDPSVLAERRTEAGRPGKSAFEKKVELRNKVAAPPFWWDSVRYSAKRLLAENPATALDPGSTGSGPVQAYAILLTLVQDVLRCADGELTVAEVRAFLREVETGIFALPSKDAIYQLVDVLFVDPAAK